MDFYHHVQTFTVFSWRQTLKLETRGKFPRRRHSVIRRVRTRAHYCISNNHKSVAAERDQRVFYLEGRLFLFPFYLEVTRGLTLAVASTRAPFWIRYRTTFDCPALAAMWRAVSPLWSTHTHTHTHTHTKEKQGLMIIIPTFLLPSFLHENTHNSSRNSPCVQEERERETPSLSTPSSP